MTRKELITELEKSPLWERMFADSIPLEEDNYPDYMSIDGKMKLSIVTNIRNSEDILKVTGSHVAIELKIENLYAFEITENLGYKKYIGKRFILDLNSLCVIGLRNANNSKNTEESTIDSNKEIIRLQERIETLEKTVSNLKEKFNFTFVDSTGEILYTDPCDSNFKYYITPTGKIV